MRLQPKKAWSTSANEPAGKGEVFCAFVASVGTERNSVFCATTAMSRWANRP